MGCRILTSSEGEAAFYCSTSMWAFGPVFTDSDEHDADERAEAFQRWLAGAPNWRSYDPNPIIASGRRDPRELSEAGLERAYSDWLAQEAEQWTREEAAERGSPDAA